MSSDSKQPRTIPEVAHELLVNARKAAAGLKNTADKLGLAPPGMPPQPAAVDMANAVQKLAEQMIGALPQVALPSWPKGTAEPLQLASKVVSPGAGGLQPLGADDSLAIAAAALHLAPQLLEKAQQLASAPGAGAAVPPMPGMTGHGWSGGTTVPGMPGMSAAAAPRAPAVPAGMPSFAGARASGASAGPLRAGWPLASHGSPMSVGALRGGEVPTITSFGLAPSLPDAGLTAHALSQAGRVPPPGVPPIQPSMPAAPPGMPPPGMPSMAGASAPSPGISGAMPSGPATGGAVPSPAPPATGGATTEDPWRSGNLLYTSGMPLHDAFDAHSVRRDFPALHQSVHGRRLVWLDNAATTQKPQWVIDAVSRYYSRDNSNVHRGAHTLAARATDAYEWGRTKVQRFIGARTVDEIVFVRGTTEAVNLVAQSWGRKYVGAGDEVLVTQIEHHSNIVPWQMLCREVGARLRPIPVDDRGEILLDAYEGMLGPRVKMVSITHVSNALGTIVPVELMTKLAHRHGATVMVDGAQAVPHFRVDVQRIDADFYAFSGHKLFAPTGIGVLHGKRELLEEMPPWQGGGSMIKTVSFESTTYSEVPAKFEAGTGNIGGAVGLGAAIDYLERINFSAAEQHERTLLTYMVEGLSKIDGVRLIGTSPNKAGVQSFVMDGLTVEQIGTFLDQRGIAVRAGHHCAQPSLQRFGLESTVRPSLAIYNTKEDVDLLLAAVSELASARKRGDFSPVGQR